MRTSTLWPRRFRIANKRSAEKPESLPRRRCDTGLVQASPLGGLRLGVQQSLLVWRTRDHKPSVRYHSSFRVQSPTCCQLHHPARSYRVSGHRDSNPEPRADLGHSPITYQLNLVPKEGLKPSTSGLPFCKLIALRQFVYLGGFCQNRER